MPGVLRHDELDITDPEVVRRLIYALRSLATKRLNVHQLHVSKRYYFSVPDGPLPSCPGWYVICDEAGSLYVGTAENLDRRLNSQDGSRDQFANPQRTNDSERNLIKAFHDSGVLGDLRVVVLEEPALREMLGVPEVLSDRDRHNVEKTLNLFRERVVGEHQMPVEDAYVPGISELWESTDGALWARALERYWGFLKPANLALEREMSALTPSTVQALDAEGWLDFLMNRYFRWKYTAPNRYATTTACLNRQVERIGLDSLLKIRDRILQASDGPIDVALSTACEIGGLGPAGGSGLLALLFPEAFGTVDQFLVKALCQVPSLAELELVRHMHPEGLTIRDGVVLTHIMRDKALSLNGLLETDSWTPRKVDMVLWTYGR